MPGIHTPHQARQPCFVLLVVAMHPNGKEKCHLWQCSQWKTMVLIEKSYVFSLIFDEWKLLVHFQVFCWAKLSKNPKQEGNHKPKLVHFLLLSILWFPSFHMSFGNSQALRNINSKISKKFQRSSKKCKNIQKSKFSRSSPNCFHASTDSAGSIIFWPQLPGPKSTARLHSTIGRKSHSPCVSFVSHLEECSIAQGTTWDGPSDCL